MISEKMQTALNNQINKEFHSAYLYLSMEAYLAEMNFKGFANWLRVQAKEEIAHGMAIYDYIIKRDGKVVLETLEKPPVDFNSLKEVFEAIVAHEKEVTKLIYDLSDLAHEENDKASASFLKWYIDEQVEEESNTIEACKKMRLTNYEPAALLILDNEFSKREFIEPVIN